MNGSRAVVAGWQAVDAKRAGHHIDPRIITVLVAAVMAALTATYVAANAGATYAEPWAEMTD